MDTKHLDHSELGMLRSTFFGTVDTERKRLKVCLISTFALGLIAHGYGFLNFTINHDSLFEFYLSVNRAWKITLGRFMVPVLRYFMGEVIVLPWLTGLTGLLFSSLAIYLVSKMFSLNKVWENVLLSGICVTNVTVLSMVASYIHDFAGDMLALLLCVCAAYAWRKMKAGFSWRYTLMGAACLGASFGFYQAYLAVMITLLCIDTIMDLLQGTQVGTAVRRLLRAAPMGILAVAAYLAGVSLFIHIYGAEVAEHYDMANVGANIPRFLELVKSGYRYAASDLFVPNAGDTLIAAGIQGAKKPVAVMICLFNGIMLLTVLETVLKVFRKRKMKGPEIALTLMMIAGLPMCMMCVSIASSWLHNLTRYAVCLYYLFVLLVFRCGQDNEVINMCKWRESLLILMIGAIIFSNVQMSNIAYVKKDLERQSALSTMTRVVNRLEAYEDYIYRESAVAIIGEVNGSGESVKVGSVENIIGLAHKSPITDAAKMEQYFDIVLQYPIALCTAEQEAEIIATEAFQQMGSFPEKDSIATINGIVVVKMSDPPQW